VQTTQNLPFPEDLIESKNYLIEFSIASSTESPLSPTHSGEPLLEFLIAIFTRPEYL
jgi:hypothetical protein